MHKIFNTIKCYYEEKEFRSNWYKTSIWWIITKSKLLKMFKIKKKYKNGIKENSVCKEQTLICLTISII